MAGDWIKMRADLFTHPKVVRISSALKADTLRTVGGLMSAWCLFDAHSVDGKLEGYAPETLDSHLRWDGFSVAMIAVGWLDSDGESLALPRFDTHNGQSAKRRAQDADRKQEVRKMSAPEADKKRTREEKRREEKKEAPLEVLPDWLPADRWGDWVEHRKAIRKPMTDKARARMLTHLAGLKAQGHDVLTLMDTAIRSGWQDVYAPKAAGQFNSPAVPRPAKTRKQL
jgi:hypothetical protein